MKDINNRCEEDLRKMVPYNPRPRMPVVVFGMETDFEPLSLVGDVHTMEGRCQPGRREDTDC